MASAEVAAVVTPVHAVTPPKRVPKPKNATERKARLDRIIAELDKLFPAATCALNHNNAWELLVATILSAQCTDERVNKVTPGLFAKYPTVQDVANASQDELANDIRDQLGKLHELEGQAQPNDQQIGSLGKQLQWETQMFQERRQVTQFVCQVPDQIEHRFFALAQVIQQNLG